MRGSQDLSTLKEEKDESMADDGDIAKANKEKEAKFRLDEAQRLADKQKEADAAAEEARRVEEANAKKMEEERLANEREEQRLADERKAQEEAERRAKEEEERVKREAEAAQAREAYEAEVLRALPPSFAHLFNPDTSGSEAALLIKDSLLPLHVLPKIRDFGDEHWVLNLQVAPLLSDRKAGLQLFFQPDKPGYDTSAAAKWTTSPLSPDDWIFVDRISSRLHDISVPEDDDANSDDEPSTTAYIANATARMNSFISTGQELRRADSAVALRRIRLADVQASTRETMVVDYSGVSMSAGTTADRDTKMGGADGSKDTFVGSLRKSWESTSSTTKVVKMTDVVIVHEK
jgi:flagellar biosynthesis GTPase FlhF